MEKKQRNDLLRFLLENKISISQALDMLEEAQKEILIKWSKVGGKGDESK